jgi:diketogulonate reductase-like aldo/keto reductase
MQQTSIDLMQFHAWNYPDPSWLDGLFHLKTVQKEGLIKHIGVTNFDAAHLRIACASGIPIVSNQICHSLLDQRATLEMSAVCAKYKVKLFAFGTLAGGFLTDKWLDKKEPSEGELTTWSQMKYKRFIDAAGGWEKYQNLLKTVKTVANKHGVSIANIATRYVLKNPNVAAVIVGARLGERNHVADNKKMLQIDLTAEDIAILKEALKNLQPIPGNCGDEYRKPPFLTASGDLSHHLENIPKPFEITNITETRQQIYSGTEWESYAGYCRAVKEGNRIHISGSTATHGSKMIGGSDAAAQTHFIIDKIEAVLQTFGTTLDSVVRTRIFVNSIADWEPIARAHGERFKGINPANTLVEAKLVGDGYLVEIEAEAVMQS